MSCTSLYLNELYKLFCSMNKKEEENKFFLLLLGFIATSLSPFLAVWYLFHCTTYVISKVLIPILGLSLVLFIGLPFLCLMRWIYGTYSFIYRIIINFLYTVTTALNVRKPNVEDQQMNDERRSDEK